jgi:hypothetical protein
MTDRDERAGGFEAEAARRYRQAAETLGPEIRSALRPPAPERRHRGRMRASAGCP